MPNLEVHNVSNKFWDILDDIVLFKGFEYLLKQDIDHAPFSDAQHVI